MGWAGRGAGREEPVGTAPHRNDVLASNWHYAALERRAGSVTAGSLSVRRSGCLSVCACLHLTHTLASAVCTWHRCSCQPPSTQTTRHAHATPPATACPPTLPTPVGSTVYTTPTLSHWLAGRGGAGRLTSWRRRGSCGPCAFSSCPAVELLVAHDRQPLPPPHPPTTRPTCPESGCAQHAS